MARLLLVLLIIVLVGAMPDWPYSGGLGYYPSGALAVVVVIAILLTMRRV